MQNNSSYSAFLDNYNSGNDLLNNSASSYLERITVDVKKIIEKETGFLKDKFEFINNITEDRAKNSYEKMIQIGRVLKNIAPDMLKSADEDVKKSGVNIISSFFDVATKTEDQQLLNTAVEMANFIKLK